MTHIVFTLNIDKLQLLLDCKKYLCQILVNLKANLQVLFFRIQEDLKWMSFWFAIFLDFLQEKKPDKSSIDDSAFESLEKDFQDVSIKNTMKTLKTRLKISTFGIEV